MVLSSSTADPRAGAPPAWLSRIVRVLHLGGDKVIVLVRGAVPARLRALVQILMDIDAGLHVYTRAPDIMDAPPGALMLLAPRAQDIGWLNLHRPLFVERRWRVVLWADDALVLALKARAPDFFDWISHVVSCPDAAGDRVPDFARAGLHSAPAYPGVVWHGGDLDAALAAAFPGEAVARASARGAYAEMVESVQQAASSAGQDWLMWTGAADARDVVRVRWAMAETGRRGRSILDSPGCAAPGWWPAGGVCMDVHDAAERLRALAGARAALLAALLDLEPGAIALAERLAADALTGLVPGLRHAGDAGAVLAREALARGIVDADDVVRRRARGLPGGAPDAEAWTGAPVLRALYDDRVVAERCGEGRARAAQWLAAFARGEQPAPEHAPGDEDMVLWAESCPAEPPALPLDWPARVAMSYWVEAVLRRAAADWSVIAGWALDLGHLDLVEHWMHQDGDREWTPAVRAQVHALRGRSRQAEAVVRAALDSMRLTARDRAHPDSAAASLDLAHVLLRQGRYEEAQAAYRDALEICERIYQTREHIQVAIAIRGLANALFRQLRYEEAEAAYHEALEIATRVYQTNEHPFVAMMLHGLANTYLAQGRIEEAEAAYRESSRIEYRVHQGRVHEGMADSLNGLASALAGLGREHEAEDVLREAIAVYEDVHGTRHSPAIIPSLCNLASLLLAQQRTGEALALARQAWDAALPGDDTARAIEAGRVLVRALHQAQQAEQAREVERRLDALLQTLPPEHPARRQPAEPAERA